MMRQRRARVSERYLCERCKTEIAGARTRMLYSPIKMRTCPYCGAEVVKLESPRARRLIADLTARGYVSVRI